MSNQNTLMNQLAPSIRLRLENQVAVVTGGARGIGEGIVRRFVQESGESAPSRELQSEPDYGCFVIPDSVV